MSIAPDPTDQLVTQKHIQKDSAYYQQVLQSISSTQKLEQLNGNSQQMENQISKMLAQRQSQSSGHRQIMENQNIKAYQTNNQLYIDIKSAPNELPSLRFQVQYLSSQNQKLKTQCNTLRIQLNNYQQKQRINAELNEDQSHIGDQSEGKKRQITQSGYALHSLQSQKTYEKTLPQIQQQYRQRISTIQKQNKNLICRIQESSAQIERLNMQKNGKLEFLQRKIADLQKDNRGKQQQILRLIEQLQKKNHTETVNLIQIPTQVVRSQINIIYKQRQNEYTNRESLPSMGKIQIKQIPVYIEKEIIREVPVPLYITNLNNLNMPRFGGNEKNEIGASKDFSKGSHLSQFGNIIMNSQSADESGGNRSTQQVHLIQIPLQCNIAHSQVGCRPINLLQIPTELQITKTVGHIDEYTVYNQIRKRYEQQHDSQRSYLKQKIGELQETIRVMQLRMIELIQQQLFMEKRNLQVGITGSAYDLSDNMEVQLLQIPVQIQVQVIQIQEIQVPKTVQKQVEVIKYVQIQKQVQKIVQKQVYKLVQIPTQVREISKQVELFQIPVHVSLLQSQMQSQLQQQLHNQQDRHRQAMKEIQTIKKFQSNRKQSHLNNLNNMYAQIGDSISSLNAFKAEPNNDNREQQEQMIGLIQYPIQIQVVRQVPVFIHQQYLIQIPTELNINQPTFEQSTRISQLCVDLQNKKDEIRQLESTIVGLHQEHQQISYILKSHIKQAQNLYILVNAKQEEIHNLKKSKQQLQIQCKQFRQRIQQLSQAKIELDDLQRSNNNSGNTGKSFNITHVHPNNTTMNRSEQEFARANKQLHEQLAAKNQTISQLERITGQLNGQIQVMEKQSETDKQQHRKGVDRQNIGQQSKHQVQLLRKLLVQKTQETQGLKNSHSYLEQKVRFMQEMIPQHIKQRKCLESQIREKQAQISALEHRIRRYESEYIDHYELEIIAHKNKIVCLEEEIRKMQINKNEHIQALLRCNRILESQLQSKQIQYLQVPVHIVQVEVETVKEVVVQHRLCEVPIEVIIKQVVVQLIQIPVQILKTQIYVELIQVPLQIEVPVYIEVPVPIKQKELDLIHDKPKQIETIVELIQIPIHVEVPQAIQQQSYIQLLQIPIHIQTNQVVVQQKCIQVQTQRVKLVQIPVVLIKQQVHLIQIPVYVTRPDTQTRQAQVQVQMGENSSDSQQNAILRQDSPMIGQNIEHSIESRAQEYSTFRYRLELEQEQKQKLKSLPLQVLQNLYRLSQNKSEYIPQRLLQNYINSFIKYQLQQASKQETVQLLQIPVQINTDEEIQLVEIPLETLIFKQVIVEKQSRSDEVQLIQIPVEALIYNSNNKDSQQVQPHSQSIQMQQQEQEIRIIQLPTQNIVRVVEYQQVEVPVYIQREVIRQVSTEVQKLVMKIVQVQVQKIVEKVVQKQTIKEVPVQIFIRKQVPVQVLKQVQVQVIKQVIKEIPVEIVREIVRQVQVPVFVDKQVIKYVERQVIKEVPVQIFRQKQILQCVQIPVQLIRYIQKQVPVYVQRDRIVQVQKQVIRQVQVQKVVEVPTIRQVIKQIPVQVEVQIIKQVEVVREVQVPVQVQVIKYVQIIKQIPIELEITKTVEVTNQYKKNKSQQQNQVQIKQVVVQKPVQIVKQVQVIKYVEIIKEVKVQVPVQVIIQVDKVRQVPFQVIKEIYIEKPVQIFVDRPVQVFVDRPVQVIREISTPIQVIKQVIIQKPVQVLRYIDRPIQVIKQVPVQKRVQVIKYVDKIKQIIKQVPVQVIRQRQVFIDRPVQVIKQVYIDRPQQIIKQVPSRPIQITKYVDRPIQTIKYIGRPVEVIKYVDRPIQIVKQVEVIRYINKNEKNESPSKRSSTDRMQRSNKISSSLSSSMNKIPNIEIPSDIHKLRNQQLSSQRSSNEDEKEKYGSKHVFGNSSSLGFVNMVDKNQQISNNDQYFNKFEEREKQLTQQNQYLFEQVQILGSTIGRQSQQIEILKRDLSHLTHDYQNLNKKLQDLGKRESVNRTGELQLKLKTQQEVRAKIERKIKDYQMQMQMLKSERTRHQKQLKIGRQERINFINQIKQMQIDIRNLDKLLEQKSFTILDMEQSNNNMKQFILLLQQNQKKANDIKNSLQDQVNYLKVQLQQEQNIRYHEQDTIKLQLEDARRIKQAMDENQRNYKTQVNNLQSRYTEILNQYKLEINNLNQELQKLTEEKTQKLGSYPTKIQETAIIRSLEEQNANLKKVVQILNSQLSYKRKTQLHTHQNNDDQLNTNGNNILKSISFSREAQYEGHPIPNSKKSSFSSKIRIEDIYQPENDQDIDTIQRLTTLVNQYCQQLQQKDIQISQLNKVIVSYEQTIQRLQGQSRVKSGNSSQIRDKSRPSIDKHSLNMNVYISNILRKLAISEENLNRERSQKMRYSMKIKQLQKQLQSEMLIQNSSYQEQDSELLQQVVFELQNQKNKNEQLLTEIAMLRQEINRASNGYEPLRRENYLSFDQNLDEQLSLQLLDNQTLLRQVKIYKAQYYKALDINRQLKAQVRILQDRLKSQSHCSSHIDTISYLSRKVDDYQNSLIPRLKDQIKKCRDSYQKIAFPQHLDYSKNYLKNQESPHFSRREQDQKRISTIRPSIEQKPNRSKRSVQYSVEQPQTYEPVIHRQTVSTFDTNLQELMKNNLTIQMKYVIAYKLVNFAKNLLQNDQIQSLCPQRIFVLYFSTTNPKRIMITKSNSKSKQKDKIKFYQAPEVLVGQSQSQKSLVWTIGVIIDQLFVGKGFYQKFAQILGPKNNYHFRLTDQKALPIGKVLQHMVVKDKSIRLTLDEVEKQLQTLVQ